MSDNKIFFAVYKFSVLLVIVVFSVPLPSKGIPIPQQRYIKEHVYTLPTRMERPGSPSIPLPNQQYNNNGFNHQPQLPQQNRMYKSQNYVNMDSQHQSYKRPQQIYNQKIQQHNINYETLSNPSRRRRDIDNQIYKDSANPDGFNSVTKEPYINGNNLRYHSSHAVNINSNNENSGQFRHPSVTSPSDFSSQHSQNRRILNNDHVINKNSIMVPDKFSIQIGHPTNPTTAQAVGRPQLDINNYNANHRENSGKYNVQQQPEKVLANPTSWLYGSTINTNSENPITSIAIILVEFDISDGDLSTYETTMEIED